MPARPPLPDRLDGTRPDVARIEIARIEAWPEPELAPLLAASAREGWRHLARLAEEWRSGANRFSGVGEGLFVARRTGEALAIGGVVADPFARKAEVGRLRRVYVLPSARRRGVGASLVRHALASASAVFRELRLRTGEDGSAAFYVALGFEPAAHLEGATHRIVLARAEVRTDPRLGPERPQ